MTHAVIYLGGLDFKLAVKGWNECRATFKNTYKKAERNQNIGYFL